VFKFAPLYQMNRRLRQ